MSIEAFKSTKTVLKAANSLPVAFERNTHIVINRRLFYCGLFLDFSELRARDFFGSVTLGGLLANLLFWTGLNDFFKHKTFLGVDVGLEADLA